MERDSKSPWAPDELGARRAGLLRGVIPFAAHARRMRVKFKMAQNERLDVLHDILETLPEEAPLGRWTRLLNRERLELS